MLRSLCAMCVLALIGACLLSGCKSGSQEPPKRDSGAIGKVAGGVKDRADETVGKAKNLRAEERDIMEGNE